jgi:hypothetical protein
MKNFRSLQPLLAKGCSDRKKPLKNCFKKGFKKGLKKERHFFCG